MTTPDKRLHAWREDLADVRLKGRVAVARFVEGVPAQCAAPLSSLFKAPAEDAMQLTQVLLGETLCVFERKNGFAFVQLDGDGYVGYMREADLAPGVCQQRTMWACRCPISIRPPASRPSPQRRCR